MDIREYIDHTLLKPEAKDDDVAKLIEEAKKYGFKAVCVNPCHIETAKKALKGTGVSVATVIGFPLGANTIETKTFETKDAVSKGADEIDMVINIGKLKSKDFEYVENEIRQIASASGEKLLKVIIETCLLTEEEKKIACELSIRAGADFVKTSTGFSTGGATVEDVVLMKKCVNGKLGVKASGGIKNCETAMEMINAGADRLGTSSGVKIVSDGK